MAWKVCLKNNLSKCLIKFSFKTRKELIYIWLFKFISIKKEFQEGFWWVPKGYFSLYFGFACCGYIVYYMKRGKKRKSMVAFIYLFFVWNLIRPECKYLNDIFIFFFQCQAEKSKSRYFDINILLSCTYICSFHFRNLTNWLVLIGLKKYYYHGFLFWFYNKGCNCNINHLKSTPLFFLSFDIHGNGHNSSLDALQYVPICLIFWLS